MVLIEDRSIAVDVLSSPDIHKCRCLCHQFVLKKEISFFQRRKWKEERVKASVIKTRFHFGHTCSVWLSESMTTAETLSWTIMAQKSATVSGSGVWATTKACGPQ